MKYIALLRGINVGGKNKVEMNRLIALFESIGLENVFTYINSGNILFESESDNHTVLQLIKKYFEIEFGYIVPMLVLTQHNIIKIAEKIPIEWINDKNQKTDVAYLFPEIDNIETIEKLPLNLELIEVSYTKGAIFWNVTRENQNKSFLSKIVGNKLYKQMTIRNINTARYLATWNV